MTGPLCDGCHYWLSGFVGWLLEPSVTPITYGPRSPGSPDLTYSPSRRLRVQTFPRKWCKDRSKMSKKCRASSNKYHGTAAGGSRGSGARRALGLIPRGPPEQSPAAPVPAPGVGGLDLVGARGRLCPGASELPGAGRVQGAGQDVANPPDDSRQTGPRARTHPNPEPGPCSPAPSRHPSPGLTVITLTGHRSGVSPVGRGPGCGLLTV
jgi:hypothetical protein